MTTRELIDWIAYFTIEQEDQKRAVEDAEDRRRGMEAARALAGMR